MSLDDMFKSVDTFSSYERGVDDFGNEYTERWNDMPEVGGTLRQKGNTSYSRALLDRYTGTESRPSKTGDVPNPHPDVEASTQNALAPLSSSRVRDRVSANRTDMHVAFGPDALEAGRDGRLYDGYNLKNRGIFRNNGKEQVRGTQRNDRMGTRVAMDPVSAAGGEREDPHKGGNVDASSAVRRRGGLRDEGAGELVVARVPLSGTDAHVGRRGNRFALAQSLADTGVVVGEGDSHRASSVGRTTGGNRIQAKGGTVGMGGWDSVSNRRVAPHETYALFSSSTPVHPNSEWDSVSTGGGGGVARRSYAQTAEILSSSISFSGQDSTRTVREETRHYVQMGAKSGRISNAHRNDAIATVHRDGEGEVWKRIVQSVSGERSTDRRIGPYRPVSTDVGRERERFRSGAGAAPPVRRRPDPTFPPNLPIVEGKGAVLGSHELNEDEGGRTVHSSSRRSLSYLSELIRAAVFGGTESQTRSTRARTGNERGIDFIAPQGESTRKTPDDSIMRSSSPTKTGRSTRSEPGVQTGADGNKSLPNGTLRFQHATHLSPDAEMDVRSSRGMDQVSMDRIRT